VTGSGHPRVNWIALITGRKDIQTRCEVRPRALYSRTKDLMYARSPSGVPTARIVSVAWLIAFLFTVSTACISAESDRGVEPRWREIGADKFVPGATTRGDVLELLGPPSQLISLGEETAFYYMLEETREKGLVLLVYNSRKEQTRYDRAVFFFDAQGVLTDRAFGR
jgi:hypothetical protein